MGPAIQKWKKNLLHTHYTYAWNLIDTLDHTHATQESVGLDKPAYERRKFF